MERQTQQLTDFYERLAQEIAKETVVCDTISNNHTGTLSQDNKNTLNKIKKDVPKPFSKEYKKEWKEMNKITPTERELRTFMRNKERAERMEEEYRPDTTYQSYFDEIHDPKDHMFKGLQEGNTRNVGIKEEDLEQANLRKQLYPSVAEHPEIEPVTAGEVIEYMKYPERPHTHSPERLQMIQDAAVGRKILKDRKGKDVLAKLKNRYNIMERKSEALTNFYKKIAKEVGFKKEASELNSPEYLEEWEDFERMEQVKEFEADFSGQTWDDFVRIMNQMSETQISSVEVEGGDMDKYRDNLDFLFVFIAGRSSEVWYRNKENSNIFIYSDDSGVLNEYPPMDDEEIRELMILACKRNG